MGHQYLAKVLEEEEEVMVEDTIEGTMLYIVEEEVACMMAMEEQDLMVAIEVMDIMVIDMVVVMVVDMDMVENV